MTNRDFYIHGTITVEIVITERNLFGRVAASSIYHIQLYRREFYSHIFVQILIGFKQIIPY